MLAPYLNESVKPLREFAWTARLCFAGMFLALTVYCAAAGAHDEEQGEMLIGQIEELANAGEDAPAAMYEDVVRQIEANPRTVAQQLLAKLDTPDTSEDTLAAYVWAVGFTKDPNAVEPLINMARLNPSELIQMNAMRSLAQIGTDKAGDFLLSQVIDAPSVADANAPYDNSLRFGLLDLLGQMQYAPAIPAMGKLLETDYRRYFWQPMFCFGKMGDKAIPYLLTKLDNPEKDVRFHALNVLARILLAEQAAKPLQKRYWVDNDVDVKAYILPALERLIYDWATMESFFADVAAKETDTELRTFAQETLDGMDGYKKAIADFESAHEDNRDAFEEQYALLYESFGKDGDFDALGRYSTHEDEEQLKRLRARILQRNSDECFYDCDELNRIIMMNRFIVNNAD